jgi:hypothetical protein
MQASTALLRSENTKRSYSAIEALENGPLQGKGDGQGRRLLGTTGLQGPMKT